jgi:polysaccharide biosynthesis protein PslA
LNNTPPKAISTLPQSQAAGITYNSDRLQQTVALRILSSAMPETRSSVIRFTPAFIGGLVFIIDLLVFICAATLAVVLQREFFAADYDLEMHLSSMILILVLFLLVRLANDSYAARSGRFSPVDWWVVWDFLLAVLVAGAIGFAFKVVDNFSRGLMGLYLICSIGLFFASRLFLSALLTKLAKRGNIGVRVIVYGAGALAERFLQRIRVSPPTYLTVLGVIDERESRIGNEVAGAPVLGGFDQLLAMARNNEVDQVVICLSGAMTERYAQIINRLEEVAVDVCLGPPEAFFTLPVSRMRSIGPIPVMYLWERPFQDWRGVAKSLEDYLVASIAILLLSPLLIVIAILVKATSRGPVFFMQKRFGFNNEVIEVFKFRSMYTDLGDATGGQRTVRGDPRVTAVGRVIRRYSLDELPQLFNVLLGQMSIVGPRPHAVAMKVGDKYYQDAVRGYAARHRVKPGITGLAQVRGLRGEIDTIERAMRRVELDLEYINNWSLGLDIRIMAETVAAVLDSRHSY